MKIIFESSFKSCTCELLFFLLLCFTFQGCVEKQTNNVAKKKSTSINNNHKVKENSNIQLKPLNIDKPRQKIKLGHSINTAANEYLPVCSPDGNKLYFSSMDRTGFFDFKLDYTKEKSAGGEDIYISSLIEGVWEDARPVTLLNTNGHEVVSQVFDNGDLIVTGNYTEKLGAQKEKNAGVQTTDLFFIRNSKFGYQINHFPEPVNSIFTEADGFMPVNESYILFVSDRPEPVGAYHKKGWKWNESFWGNTDIYVSIKDGDYWSIPINLGKEVNTPFSERTPWLSKDELTLYISSNGYVKNKTDLNVYAFKRKSIKEWNKWDGPYIVEDANTIYDDWGYKETSSGDAYVASANKLNFNPTQSGVGGDGGIRETNYRPGYEVYGLQTASLNREFETNIYHLQNIKTPFFIASDLFFDFNSFSIKKSFEKYLLLLVDQISINKKSSIEIHGYTDNVGTAEYNMQLSNKRAKAVKDFLVENGVTNSIVSEGFGLNNPAFPNTTKSNRKKNRRVEVYIRNVKYD